jgi:esterase/lipase
LKLVILVAFAIISSLGHAGSFATIKQAWVQQLDSCRQNCAVLSRQIFAEYKGLYPGAEMDEKSDASFTLLYLHSYSMSPRELSSFHGLFQQLKRMNFVAPVFSGHQVGATAEEIKAITPEDWILDADLSFKLALALGKPVVVQGYSMGGVSALDLAMKYPQQISKLVLMAPALKITSNIEGLVCAGKIGFIQSLVQKITGQDGDSVAKFLNGACSLKQLIQSIRKNFPLDTSYENRENGNLEVLRYKAEIERFKLMGKSINIPTLMIFAEDDQAVDAEAMKAFAEGLPHGQIIYYDKTSVGHFGIIQNIQLPTSFSTLYTAMMAFITP